MKGLRQTLRAALGAAAARLSSAPGAGQARFECWTLRETTTGDMYRIECRWNPRGRYYEMFILERPSCSYPVGYGGGHVLETNRVCVAEGREPQTIERAKAIAIHWLCGFSSYRRTGEFPNGQVRVDVKNVHRA